MNRIRKIATLATLTIAPLTVFAVPTTAQADSSVTVIDGDTLVVNGEKIRVQGIDTPERGEACYAEATEYLQELVASGNVRVTNRDGEDRYDRTIASISVDGIDIGMEMIRSGLARARYDSRDGYGYHSHEGAYHAAERSGHCTMVSPTSTSPFAERRPPAVEPEQGETTPPFWTWAALGAVAAERGVDFSLFDVGINTNAHRLSAVRWIDRTAEAAWYAAAAENERIAKAAAEAAWYAAAAANERAEAERVATEQRERAERERSRSNSSKSSSSSNNNSGNSSSGGGNSSRLENDNPYDDGGPRRADGSCPPGGCT